MVCAAKGYKATLTMPDDVNIERVALLRAYGARVILTHRSELMLGAINKAEEILREHPDYFSPSNSATQPIHKSTARPPPRKSCILLAANSMHSLLESVREGLPPAPE